MHHPIYSAVFPSGSAHLGGVLDHAMVVVGRAPCLALAADTSNYKGFARVLRAGERVIPLVIAVDHVSFLWFL